MVVSCGGGLINCIFDLYTGVPEAVLSVGINSAPGH